MTLSQLQYFSVTARELHFGRAARLLHIAQPSLSCAIANLEEEAGLPLFHRRGRSIQLTEAGLLLQKQAARILEQVDCTQRQLSLLRDEADANVSLTYTSTLLAAGLPQMLSRFARQYEGPFHLSTDEVPTQEALLGLKDGKYDLALCMKAPADPELFQVPLFQADYVLTVPKDSPLTDSVTLEEAARCPFVIYRASLARSFVEELFHEAGLTPDFRHFTYSDDAAMQLVGSGLGISIVNSMPYQERDLVRVLRPAWLRPHTHDIYLTHCADVRLGRAAQALKNYLLAQQYLP